MCRLAARHISPLKGVTIVAGPMAINIQPLRGCQRRLFHPWAQMLNSSYTLLRSADGVR